MHEEEEMLPLMDRTPRVTSFESKDNELLSDMTHHQLVGNYSTFDTMVFAISTVEKLQNPEALQPELARKPKEMIQNTLEATTQKGHQLFRFPMQNTTL